ncbi:MAG: hypothetical protein IJV31_09205 [Clostridia bacterium]|nr:hypothetical protein [Clostridia bacterium]
MKDKIITFFIVIIMLILIVILGGFGLYVYLSINGQETIVTEIITTGQDYISRYTDNEQSEQTSSNFSLNDLNIFSSKQTPEEKQEEVQQLIQSSSKNLYYYEQLNNYSKIIYKTIDQNIEQMKTGNYKVVLGDYFNDLLDQEDGWNLLGDYYQAAVSTYLYDNPEVFYLNPAKMFLNIQTTTTTSKFLSAMGKSNVKYELEITCGNNDNYYADDIYSKEQIETLEKEIEQEVNTILAKVTGKSDYQKISIIHDYLVDNLSYDQEINKPFIYNIYGALVNKKCVCEGYAKAYKYLLDKCGIESIIVIGIGQNSSGQTENHAWNYVKLNNSWYAVDVTWDDPVIIGRGKVDSKLKNKYFLVGSSEINKDHTASNNLLIDNGQEYYLPVLEQKNYSL